jgi:hypothetical protein
MDNPTIRQRGNDMYTNDIRVQDEERRIVLAENIFGQSKGPGGTQRFSFNGKSDAHIVLLFILAD